MYIVYKTTNLLNNKIYIGVHKMIKKDNYLGSGKYLKRAIKKYGEKNFKREILFNFNNKKDAFSEEADIVTKDFCLINDNYNICTGGKGGFEYINTNNIYTNHSEKTKNKIRKFNVGRKTSKETKEKIRIAMKGRKITWNDKLKIPKTEEHKLKISKTLTGNKLSNLTKKKLSESMLRYWKIKKAGECTKVGETVSKTD